MSLSHPTARLPESIYLCLSVSVSVSVYVFLRARARVFIYPSTLQTLPTALLISTCTSMFQRNVRMGAPALTTRGFTDEDFEAVAEFFDRGVSLAQRMSKSGLSFLDFEAGSKRGEREREGGRERETVRRQGSNSKTRIPHVRTNTNVPIRCFWPQAEEFPRGSLR